MMKKGILVLYPRPKYTLQGCLPWTTISISISAMGLLRLCVKIQCNSLNSATCVHDKCEGLRKQAVLRVQSHPFHRYQMLPQRGKAAIPALLKSSKPACAAQSITRHDFPPFNVLSRTNPKSPRSSRNAFKALTKLVAFTAPVSR